MPASAVGVHMALPECNPRRHVSDQPGLSLIVPVFNEAENFPGLVAEVERHVPRPFTMFVVYDFAEDTTVPIAQSLATTRPWLQLLRNAHGRGVVGALKTGFASVREGPALVVMADLSDDLRIVPRMLSLYREGYQVVCPSRYVRGGRQLGGPRLKGTLSRWAGLSLHRFAGLPTHDATNNFRLYAAELVNQLGIKSAHGFEVALELTARAFRHGVKIAELPAVWRDRTIGTSRFRLVRWLPGYLRWYGYACWASLVRRWEEWGR